MILDHIASKWDRSPASLAADVARSVKQGADVITFTEVADGKRWTALQRKGWTTCQDRTPWQKGEVAAMVGDHFGKVLHWETVQIAPDLGPGLPVVVIIVVIELHNGRVLMVSDSHLPSSVEDKWKERRGGLYREAVWNYVAACDRVAREWKPDAQVRWADWNLNLNLAWVRDWAKGLWKNRGRLMGLAKVPKQGTHGNRLIDWPVTHGVRKRRLKVLPRTKASDHRAVRLTGVIGRARKS